MGETSLFKICFVAPDIYGLFNPQSRSPYDDGDMQIYELARYFARNDQVEVVVITGDFGQDDIEYYNGVLVYRSGFEEREGMINRYLKRGPSFTDLLQEVNADIYMMCGASGVTAPVANYCKKRKKAFVFRASHQRDCDGTFIHGTGVDGNNFEYALTHAAVVIAQSQEQKTMLRRSAKVTAQVIPNAIPIQSNINTPRDDVLWIGEIVDWKQPERFLRLALTVTHQEFTLIAQPRNFDLLERLVESNRDIPNLGINNSVPYHEYPRFLLQAKLLVNTSRFEGFPYVCALALGCGTPIVTLNTNPDNLLNTHEIGRFADGSEVHLAYDVSDLSTYENQRLRFQKNAYNFACEFLDINKVGQEYLKLLLKLA